MIDRIKKMVQAERGHRKAKKEGTLDDLDLDVSEYDEFYASIEKAKNDKQKQILTFMPDPRKEAQYYEILEVPQGSNFETIKKAYRDQVRAFHPDKFNREPEKQKIAQTITSQLNEAYRYFELKFAQ